MLFGVFSRKSDTTQAVDHYSTDTSAGKMNTGTQQQTDSTVLKTAIVATAIGVATAVTAPEWIPVVGVAMFGVISFSYMSSHYQATQRNLEEQLKQVKAENSQLRTTNIKLIAKNETLIEDSEVLKAEKASLEDYHTSQLAKQENKITTLKVQVQSATDYIEDSTKQSKQAIGMLSNQYCLTNLKLEQTERQLQRLRDSYLKDEDLKHTNKALQAKVQYLSQIVDKTVDVQDELTKAKKEVQELKTKNTHLQQENRSLQEKQFTSKIELSDLNMKLTNSQERIAFLQRTILNSKPIRTDFAPKKY